MAQPLPHPSAADSGLLDAVVAIAGHLDLTEVLDLIVRHACRLTGAAYGALGVLSTGSAHAHLQLEQFHFVGLSAEQARLLGDFPRGHGVLGVLIDDPRPLRLAQLSDHPASVGLPPTHPPMHTFLGVPIRVGGAVFGNLYLCEKAGGENFTDEDEELIVGLAAAAGIAVDNARLFAASRARQSWLAAAARAAAEIGYDLTAAPDLVARLAAVAGDCTRVAVALPTAAEEAGPLVPWAPGRRTEGTTERLGVNGASGVDAGRLLGRAVPLGPDGRPSAAALFGAPAQECVEVRLDGGGPEGSLLLHRAGGRWSAEEAGAVQAFAGQVALALERVRNEHDRHRLAVFQDRDRIARDLHDRVIQRIFAVGLGLHSLLRRVSDDDGRGRLRGYIEDLNTTITEIRTSIFFLHHDPGAGAHTLRGDVMTVVGESARILGFDPRVTFVGPVDQPLPPHLRTDLLATLRESLSNVIRHAAASTVDLRVHWDVAARLVSLEVADDGIGLEPGAVGGLGLRNTAARAEAAGGSARVGPREGGGTSFRWTVPVPPHKPR